MAYEWGWRPYVPVAQRRVRAVAQMEKLRKKGLSVQPVRIDGRQIARTFWGRAWCEHLEKFSDYANRLPRGRTYVRNGSVCHLDIAKGRITAKVSGSEIYDIQITIKALAKDKWQRVKDACAGQVGSLLELLQGKLSDHVMATVTDRDRGLFPLPKEISLGCSCPDWAVMCKHVAAAMYGIGARLDERPELLFVLRGVDHADLVTQDVTKAVTRKTRKTDGKRLADSELSEVFGIDLAPVPAVEPAAASPARLRRSAPQSPRQIKPVVRRRSQTAAPATTGTKGRSARRKATPAP